MSPPRSQTGRVLQIVQPESGGSAVHALALSLGLQARGWAVEVATSSTSLIRPALDDAGIPVHLLPFSGRPARADWRDLRALPALRDLDRSGSWDLVHAHSSKAGAIARLSLPRERPLFYTPHCFAFAARWSVPKRAAYWAVEQALVTRAIAIIAVCRWERDLARHRLLGAASRTVLIEHGVPPCSGAAPDPELVAFKGDRPLAGIVARLDDQKDVLTPLLAMRRVIDRRPEAGRLAIVGNGPMRVPIEAEITRLGLEGEARCFDFGGAVGPYLNALDLFVLSSRWESLPLGILEAMRCGLPVLASRVGGIPDAVEDGVTGRLVPRADVEAFAAALEALFGDPTARERLGGEAKGAATRRFDVERMVDLTARLYQPALLLRGSRGRARPRTPEGSSPTPR
jgi:glycosyltransferase involved in cell wall biosynthesis